MRINSIHIQNFRKLQSCKIDFSEKETIFVGANNSGKKTAMDALKIFLKTKSFKTQDFTLCKWKNLNQIGGNWIKVDELKEEDRIVSFLKPYLPRLDLWIEVDDSKLPFVEKADQMLFLSKEFQGVSGKFQRTYERKFKNLNLNKKLQDWYKLSHADFIKELAKEKINFTLSEEAEWADYFDQEKSNALEIQSKTASTDKAINQMVYELYGLTEEEIGIVEGNQL